jgi:hypothetical protein
MLELEARALFNGGGPEPLSALPGARLSDSLPPAQLISPASAPQLSSHPSSAVKVYLDFTGAPAQTWGPFTTTTTPAYDTDGDDTSFSSNETNQIREIWSRVAEKFSPFNVDVTTVDPGDYPYFQVARMVIGGNGAWAGGVYGGYSYVNGFVGATSNTGWIFPKNLGSGRPKYVAEATAHEAGHLFGLTHQSAYSSSGAKIDEYRGGRDPAAPNAADPIMGFSYYAARGLWAKGASADGSTVIQDDLGIISRPYSGFGYRDDDHGNSRLTADLLNIIDGTGVSAIGVIEQSTDADYFKFSSPGGDISLTADVAPFGPMLDLALTLTDADGNVLASSDTASLGETIATTVPAGEYYLAVSSHGGYGDIGQYAISGSVPEPGTVAVVLLGVGWVVQRRERRMAFTAS